MIVRRDGTVLRISHNKCESFFSMSFRTEENIFHKIAVAHCEVIHGGFLGNSVDKHSYAVCLQVFPKR